MKGKNAIERHHHMTDPTKENLVVSPHSLHGLCAICVLKQADLRYAMLTWAARYNTWLLIKLTPKSIVFSFLFFLCNVVCLSKLPVMKGQNLHAEGQLAAGQIAHQNVLTSLVANHGGRD